MASNTAQMDERVFLDKGCEVELSDGRKIAVPRWSARKALMLGSSLASALKETGENAGEIGASGLTRLIPFLGEMVCGTLDEPEEFLDGILKEDLLKIALAIVRQEFLSEEWKSLSKKAGALLPHSASDS